MYRKIRLLAVVILTALLLYGVKTWRHLAVPGWGRYQPQPAAAAEERKLQAEFLGDRPAAERFDTLFNYFLSGFLTHATADFSSVHYSGVGSDKGFQVTGLEGFARTAPVLAAWIYSGRDRMATDPRTGAALNLVDILKQGILAGVSPQSPSYWGPITDYDQRIVEAADIARVLWLTRDTLWVTLRSKEKARVSAWLSQAAVAKTWPSNWMLLPVTVNLVLAQLAPEGAERDVQRARAVFDDYRYRYYLENGWFFDAPHGVDYYNTWAITYELFWFQTLNPTFEPEFLTQAVRESADLTAHLISPKGIPIMGRSICYRTSIPSPVIAASLLDPTKSAQAARALDVVWRYFITHDALRDGGLSQGYFGPDPRILDKYSGAGSCQLGTRSLVLAFMHRSDDAFWAAPPAPLPVEMSDYSLDYPKLGWKVSGRQASGEIVIELPHNDPGIGAMTPYTLTDRALEMLLHSPHRPHNSDAKYGSRTYSSAEPFMLLNDKSM